MRVFIGGLITETNTFAPFPTSMSGFAEYGLTRETATTSPFSGPSRVYRERTHADGFELIEGMTFVAQPSGLVVRSVYETLRDRVLDELRRSGPVDIVLLTLHGAMVADGYDDCEGDILTRVRSVAPDSFVGCVLDPHCHLTHAMIEAADVIITAKEYPHVDFADRAHELYDLAVATRQARIRPVAALFDTRVIGFYPTGGEPMRSIVDDLKRAEQSPILSVSLAHGFPWGDVADVGARVLVYADGDGAAAGRTAEAFGRRLYDERHGLQPDLMSPEASLELARTRNGRCVLGDFADNPGGGAPGDSTFLLQALLDGGTTDVAIGAFWDPLVAKVCADAGVGAVLPIRLGGKCGPTSGSPIDLEVEVRAVVESHDQGVFGARQPMGLSVWLRAQNIDMVVCSIRTQVFEPDAFTGLGVDLSSKRLIIVKSSAHFRAGFQSIADHVWSVATPGALSTDFGVLPYRKRQRNYYPAVDDPWSMYDRPAPKVFGR